MSQFSIHVCIYSSKTHFIFWPNLSYLNYTELNFLLNFDLFTGVHHFTEVKEHPCISLCTFDEAEPVFHRCDNSLQEQNICLLLQHTTIFYHQMHKFSEVKKLKTIQISSTMKRENANCVFHYNLCIYQEAEIMVEVWEGNPHRTKLSCHVNEKHTLSDLVM